MLSPKDFPAGACNTALLRQKEASDISAKSELLMFSYFIQLVCSSSRPNFMHKYGHLPKR